MGPISMPDSRGDLGRAEMVEGLLAAAREAAVGAALNFLTESSVLHEGIALRLSSVPYPCARTFGAPFPWLVRRWRKKAKHLQRVATGG